jgi:CSLREA domain-containing protein
MSIRTQRRPTLTRRRPVAPRARLFLASLEKRDVPATFFVTNLLDGPVTGGGQLPGSLRQAIFDANANPGADVIDATAVTGTITMNARVNTTLAADILSGDTTCVVASASGISVGTLLQIEDELVQVSAVSGTTLTIVRGQAGTTAAFHAGGTAVTSAYFEYTISDSVTLTGPGAGKLTIDAGKLSRHFIISDNTSAQINVSMSGATLVNGLTSRPRVSTETANGGSMLIRNEIVALDGMVIRNSGTHLDRDFANNGGAIAAGAAPVAGDFLTLGASLTVNNSAIEDNTVGGGGLSNGGGIYFFFPNKGGTFNQLAITNSSVTGNTAYGRGGGIYFTHYTGLAGSSFTMRNTTVSNNVTLNEFGAGVNISGSPVTTITNSTISSNRALTGSGGGLSLNQGVGPINIESTIISGNVATGAAQDLLSFTNVVVNSTNNLIGSTTGLLNPGADFVNKGGTLFGAPGLAVLANNGGITRAQMPLATSAAINKGSNPAGLTTDQRGAGFARVIGGTADIGAAEFDPALPFATAVTTDVTAGGATPNSFTVTFTDDVGINVATIKNNNNAVRVTGPGGFDVPATYVSLDDDTNNGTPRTATYTFAVPGGSWDYLDNGVYSVVIQKDQVADTGGNFLNPSAAPGGPVDVVGQFTVAVGRSLVVTSAADSGPGSLREAIDFANANAFVSDTITFDTAAMGGNLIALFAVLPTQTALTITDPVVINGGGGIVLDALLNARHMVIDGVGKMNVTLSNLTFTNGKVLNGAGAAISVDNENLTLIDCTFTNNEANKSQFIGGGAGGAIAANGIGGSSLTVIRGTFDANYSGTGSVGNNGGAIVGAGTLAVQDSTFTNNVSQAGSGAAISFGGGITITGSTFAGNTAAASGGALSLTPSGALLLQNNTLTGNTAGGAGGGLAVSTATTTGRFLIANSTIVDNVALSGAGGGVSVRADTNYLFDFENTVISGNKSVNIAPDLFVGKANGSLGPVQLMNNSFIGIYDPVNGKILGVNNQLGTPALPLNATLAPLANNGGPTQTRRPFGGSPLVNVAAPGAALATLTANLTATATSATVASTAGLVAGMYLQIGSEIVRVTAITSATAFAMGNFLAPQRGLLGTTAAAHSSGAGFGVAYTQPATDQRGPGFPRVVGGKVDIGAVEIELDTPSARLTTPLAVVTAPGQTPYQFNVTFTDDAGLNVGTINGNSSVIRVTGPNFYDQLATFVNIVSNTGTAVVVTYQITAPGPNWVGTDNGYYTVATEPNQVSDLGGKFVEQYPIGTLRVSLPLSLVVNATNDESIDTDGKLSLREAILAANANVFAPDTITFSPTVFATPQTITLTEGELFIGDALAINGPGAALATIKGVDKRLFTIDTVDVKAAVSISNLTLTGGTGESTISFNAGVAGGGAIMNFDEALTLEGVVLTGNSAVLPDINGLPNAGSGGAILLNSRQASLVMNNSVVSGNAAGSGGGGIALRYGNTSMTISNSVITNNRAGQFGSGGGIEGSWSTGPGVGGSTITIDNSTVADNVAGSSGGGVFSGGGINAIPTKLTITNSTITGNAANTSGGGVFSGSTQYLTVRNSTITGNAARTSGGGIVLTNNTAVSGNYGPNAAIINTIIAGNTNKFTPDVSGGSSTTTFTLPVINSIIGVVDPAVQKFNNIGSLFGTLAAPVDPLLGPGVYNGGPAGMITFLPRAGSPALNAGTATPVVPVATLAAPASAGDTTIKVNSQAAFLGGTSFQIGGEIVSYKSAGSVTVTLNAPLASGYASGTVVNRAPQPASPANDQRGPGFPRQIGAIDIGAVEVNPAFPTAEGVFAAVTTAGATSQSLTITFRDDLAINVATLIGNNNAVRVTGPGGFDVPATFVSIDVNTNGTPRSATYSFTPPGGSWDAGDDGLYGVNLQPNQVADTSGNFVFGTTVNTLRVAIPRTLVVTNDNDFGAGSLRDAVEQANANTNVQDVITFDPAFFSTPRTILFALGEVVVTDPVTITGPGANFVTFDGGGQNRHFNLQMPAAQWGATVAISGVTITNGIGKSLPGVGNQGSGGSINNDSANLVVDNVVVTNNQNGGNSGGFTVLNSIYASMTASNSTFSFNNGFSGGVIFINGGLSGIANSCVVNLVNCKFESNVGTTTSGSGGAVNIGTGGTLNVTGGTFTGNSSGTTGSSGGAILVGTNGTLNVQSSLFESNFTGTTGNGGAVSVSTSTSVANIQTSSFKTNVAGNTLGTGSGGHGGAIFVASGGKLFLDGSTLSGNVGNSTSTTGGGGGIYLTGTAQVTVTNSTLSGNIAKSLGGGIHLNSLTLNATPSLAGALSVRNSTVAFNSAANGGGGISWRTSSGTGTPAVSVVSTIVAQNDNQPNPAASPDLRSGAAAQAFLVNNSLIGATDGSFLAGGSANNLTGTIAAPVNPLLAALAGNGGPTETHALQVGSVAINAGSNPAGLAFDQRGATFNRAAGPAADIGAFEVQVGVAPPTASVVVNNGAAQRSMVTSIKVSFSEAVSFPNGIAAAFSLVRTGPGGPPASASRRSARSAPAPAARPARSTSRSRSRATT